MNVLARFASVSVKSVAPSWHKNTDELPARRVRGFESAIAATGLAVHVGDNDHVFGSYRHNNSLKYQSPMFGSLRAEAM